jgi:uncharacterized membrane protein
MLGAKYEGRYAVLKWISPLEETLRHIQRPRMFSERGHLEPDSDQPATGQILAEKVAGSIGSWRFIGAQAGVMAIWVLINTLAFFNVIHFDTYPFVFLNLAMSAEAAFTGPVLLIAANVGAIRDHAQSSRIEKLTAQNETLGEQSEKLVDRMYQLEQMVDEHIAASARAHSAEIADLTDLVRAVHTTVCSLAPNGGASAPTSLVLSGDAAVPTASAAPTAVDAPAVPQRSPSRRRRSSTSTPGDE